MTAIVETSLSVEYEELDGSPTAGIEWGVWRARRQLKCRWADWKTLATELLGGSKIILGTRVWIGPCAFPWEPKAYASRVDMVPMGRNTAEDVPDGYLTHRINTYEWAVLNVSYEVPKWGASTKTDPDDPTKETTVLCSQSWEPTAEYITVPGMNLYWDAPCTLALALDEAPQRYISTGNWVYTMHREPKIPDGIDDLVNKVNNASIQSSKLNRTFAPETLLFKNPTMEQEITVDSDDNPWRITLRMMYRKEGWNKFPRAGFTENQTIYRAVNTPFVLFESASFTRVIAEL